MSSILQGVRQSFLLLWLGVMATALLSLSLPASAEELFPWRAEYRASYKTGVPISGSAVRELKRRSDGTWLYNFDVDSIFVDVQEHTRLLWRNGLVVPIQYQYLRSSWLRKRKARLDFDWKNLKVRNDVQNQPWFMEIPEETQDKLSYQLQLHMDLIQGKQEMHYKVADGGTLKELEFKVMGEEVLDTKLGRVATVYVDRVRPADDKRFTRLWFAKDWSFLLVRMIQREEDGETYEINLDKATVKGKTIK